MASSEFENRIYLLGFMGSGKSTFGRELAQFLNWPFYDLDEWIESQEGCAIPELFDRVGEEGFRQIESKALKQTHTIKQGIIATGGGTPCFFDHMEWINAHGLSIYLDVSTPILVRRLSGHPDKRPLLREVGNLTAFVEAKLAQRSPFYERAHLVYHIHQMEVEVEALGRYIQFFTTS